MAQIVSQYIFLERKIDLKIIDGHVHLVEKIAGFCRRGELRANGDIMKLIPRGYGDKDFTGEALIRLMDDNDIEKAALMQGSLYGFQNEYSNLVSYLKYAKIFDERELEDIFYNNALKVYFNN